VRSCWWCGAHEGLPGRRVGDSGSSDLHARDDNGADRCAEIEDGAMIRSEARPYPVSSKRETSESVGSGGGAQPWPLRTTVAPPG
jgi:hypothetical protein